MIVHWDVSPDILTLGPFTLRWYGVLFGLGFVIGFGMMRRIFKRQGRPLEHLDVLLVCMILGTALGARLGHCLFYEPDIYLQNPIRMLYIWEGGLASHGGTLGNMLAIYCFSKLYGYDTRWVIDQMAMAIALASCLIRLGNLMTSEIIGKPTSGNWGVVFVRIDQVPRHPAMLYEAIAYGLTFVLMRHVYYKTDWASYLGRMWGLLFICIWGTRFVIEYVKEPQASFEQGMMLNMGQVLSLPFILLGMWLMYRSTYHPIGPVFVRTGRPAEAP